MHLDAHYHCCDYCGALVSRQSNQIRRVSWVGLQSPEESACRSGESQDTSHICSQCFDLQAPRARRPSLIGMAISVSVVVAAVVSLLLSGEWHWLGVVGMVAGVVSVGVFYRQLNTVRWDPRSDESVMPLIISVGALLGSVALLILGWIEGSFVVQVSGFVAVLLSVWSTAVESIRLSRDEMP